MALPVSPQKHRELKALLICFSIANLCFIRRWYEIDALQAVSLDYYRSAPVSAVLLFATVTAALLVGAGFRLAWLCVEKRPSTVARRLAHCTFLFVLIYPLESIRRYWNTQSGHMDWVANLALLSLEAMLAAGVVMAAYGAMRIVNAAKRVALLLGFMLPVMLLDFYLTRVNSEPAVAFDPKASSPMLPPQAAGAPRLIWIVFDELDQHIAFDARPASVEMPELDRLRSESVVANHATQTAPWTVIAVPSLFSERFYGRSEMINADTLHVFPEDAGPAGTQPSLNWSDQPSAFTRARQLGINAELIGWHHPYCRVLGEQMVRCFTERNGHPTGALLRETHASDLGVIRTIGLLFQLQFANFTDLFRGDEHAVSETVEDQYLQRRQLGQYFRIRDRAYSEATDPSIGFLVIHFPTPHLFPIYNRRTRDFTLEASLSYLDNLALVDRTMGELRESLEHAGMWGHTSILLTSDHGLRPEVWRGRRGWTPEIEALTGGAISETVPFILKLAGSSDHAEVQSGFSNIVSVSLALEVLRGAVVTPQQAVEWLENHAAPRQSRLHPVPDPKQR